MFVPTTATGIFVRIGSQVTLLVICQEILWRQFMAEERPDPPGKVGQ